MSSESALEDRPRLVPTFPKSWSSDADRDAEWAFRFEELRKKTHYKARIRVKGLRLEPHLSDIVTSPEWKNSLMVPTTGIVTGVVHDRQMRSDRLVFTFVETTSPFRFAVLDVAADVDLSEE